MKDEKNLYDVLEIPTGSKEVMIKRAYRRLQFIYHPDTRNKQLSAEKNEEYDIALAAIQEAYEILSNPAMKEAYNSVVTVLEEQKDTKWNDESQGIWNIPAGHTTPYSRFTSSSTSYTSGSAGIGISKTQTSSSASFVPRNKIRYSIRISNVAALGLTGLVSGQIVNLSYTTPSHISLTINVAPGATNNIPCRILSVHYGASVGIPAYADFELEEL